MAKTLKDILAGVKSSKKISGKLGKDPGVDYMPKAGDEADFAGKHEIEVHADRVGNDDGVYTADKIKYVLAKPEEKRHGYKKPEDKKVNESMMKSEAKCNMTEAGTECPVHGMKECWSMKPIKEDDKKMDVPFEGPYDKPSTAKTKNVAKNAARKAMKKAMTKEEIELEEKHLTPAELKKREEIAKAIAKKNPKMEMGKKMAIATATAKKVAEEVDEYCQYMIQEDLAVPLLGGDMKPRGSSDEAAEMVKSELKALANKAMHLVMNMPDTMHIEPWVQAKIAQAKSYVSDVHDYCIYGDHDKEEDEQMDTPMQFPNMSVDVNTGRNV